jgi:RHS repeat-associated protein
MGYRGELEFAGLIWLRHRVYDPATGGFLSPDPLPPLLGSAAVNPYSYAGGDPVGSLDPLGLQPMTDAEAQQMAEAEDKPWYEDAWDWVVDNGDELAAGALAVGAAALIVTGVGAPIGAGILIGMGVSGGLQLATTGEVDARQLWISGLAGGLSGGVGAGAGALTAGSSAAVRLTAQAGAGAIADAGFSATSQYLTTGQIDPGRVLVDGTIGAVAGGGGQALGDVGHAAISRLRGGATAASVAVPGPAALEAGSSPAVVDEVVDASSSGARGPDFVADANGTAVPTSRSRLEGGFQDAGFPSWSTEKPGTGYNLPNGTVARVMEPAGQAPLRASFTNEAGGPISPFTDKPVQPPPGLTAAERKAFVRSRTHIDLGP